MNKIYKIEVCEVPGQVSNDYRWQADAGTHHSRGKTPGEAVDRLIRDLRAMEQLANMSGNSFAGVQWQANFTARNLNR